MENRKSKISGGKGIRTPDFQLAKLALYQLSYAPCEFSSLNCGLRIANEGALASTPVAGGQGSKGPERDVPTCDIDVIHSFAQRPKPDDDLTIATRPLCGFRRRYVLALRSGPVFFSLSVPQPVPPYTLLSHR
jgi:hypothetical protein